MQEIHQKMRVKTEGSLQNIRMITKILNKFKQKIPTELFISAIFQKQAQVKKQLQQQGANFDKSHEELVKNMKGKSFDFKKLIQKRSSQLSHYYQVKNQEERNVDELQLPEKNCQRTELKTKKIRKTKGIKKTYQTKQSQEIFEQSAEYVQNFMIL